MLGTDSDLLLQWEDLYHICMERLDIGGRGGPIETFKHIYYYVERILEL